MIIKSVKILLEELKSVRCRRKKINFIPTMGNLHQAHLNLVKIAKKEGCFVIVSIFVNPLQFNDQKDFKNYPRTLKNDLRLLENLSVDLVFVPGNDFVDKNVDGTLTTLSKVNLRQFSNLLCGIDRPGHFEGVATIILKFLLLIKPDFIFLGEKDFQQILIIKQVIKDFEFKAKIISQPVIRDENGLALSSRNKLLSRKNFFLTKFIFENLKLISSEIITQGFKLSRKSYYEKRFLKQGLLINYLEILKDKDLSNIDEFASRGRIFVSVEIGKIRLIDNLSIKKKMKLINGKIISC